MGGGGVQKGMWRRRSLTESPAHSDAHARKDLLFLDR